MTIIKPNKLVEVAFKFDICVVCSFIKPNKLVEVVFKFDIDVVLLIIDDNVDVENVEIVIVFT